MRPILLVFLSLVLSACVVHRLDVASVEVTDETPIVVSSPVKAHLYDGSTVVFADGIRVANGIIHGNGQRYDLTLENTAPVTEIAVEEVAAMESYQTPVSTGATTVATTGSTIGIVLATVMGTALIFGSCPTVYAFDGERSMLEAELFSYSISPSFQSRDIDRLGIQSLHNGVLQLELRNEMLETHYIDNIEVQEVVHAPNEHVYPDQNGRPLVIGSLAESLSAFDQTGRDIRAEVRQNDDLAWSATDERLAAVSETDYLDHLDFEFAPPPPGEDLALMLRLRNSLLNTVLFYDVMLKEQSFRALDWMGHDLDHIGNKLEMGRWYRKQMGMTVSVWDKNRYRKVARINDQGPIAWNEHAIRVPVKAEGPVKIRLTFVADNWRLDRVAAATAVSQTRARTISVAEARGADGEERSDVVDFLQRSDRQYLITKPQDHVSLYFDAGPLAEGKARTFFVASEGYYMEWMRPDWLAESHRSSFQPGQDALLRAIALYSGKRDGLRTRFEATKLAVR